MQSQQGKQGWGSNGGIGAGKPVALGGGGFSMFLGKLPTSLPSPLGHGLLWPYLC